MEAVLLKERENGCSLCDWQCLPEQKVMRIRELGPCPAAQSGAFSPISKRFRVQFPVGEHTWVAGLMPVRVQPWVRVK